MSYYFPDPPYFLLLAGLFIGVTSGAAFGKTLKQTVREWSQKRSNQILQDLRGIQLQLPFLGMCVGICIFLASGLEIFAFPVWFAYSISTALTIVSAALVWFQLGKLLEALEKGGSKALDLDSIR